MYPKQLCVRSQQKFINVDCKTAFCFAAIRKKLVKAWEITATGPSIDPDESEGTTSKPLDISDLQVSLTDFKLLNMLLSEKEHQSVKNLTEEQIKSLDEAAVKLKMDTYQWLYIGRSRIGDETGNQIEVTFHGNDLLVPQINQKYEI
jgi:hypothetical protein